MTDWRTVADGLAEELAWRHGKPDKDGKPYRKQGCPACAALRAYEEAVAGEPGACGHAWWVPECRGRECMEMTEVIRKIRNGSVLVDEGSRTT